MKKFKISVLVGIYNCQETLQEALDSLYAQTCQDFQIILCDDGSTDRTFEIAQHNANLHHDKIILIKNQKNMGLNYTLNRCLERADTEFVARMDGDDISLPSRFEKELNFLEQNPQYSVVSVPMIYFDDKGEFRRGRGKGDVVARDFVKGSPVCHAPCMARTAAFRSVGGYSVSEKLIRVEDYHLWFKLYAAGHKLYMMDECLYMMRDDRKAKSRRKWVGRRNTFGLMNWGFREIGLPWYYHIYALRPIVTYLLPEWLYRFFHKRKR